MKALKAAILVLTVTVLGACGKSSGSKKANLMGKGGVTSQRVQCGEIPGGTPTERCQAAVEGFRASGDSICRAGFAKVYNNEQCKGVIPVSDELNQEISCFKAKSTRKDTAPAVQETIDEAICDEALVVRKGDGEAGSDNEPSEKQEKPRDNEKVAKDDSQDQQQEMQPRSFERLIFVRSQDYNPSTDVVVGTRITEASPMGQQQVAQTQQPVVRPSSGVITFDSSQSTAPAQRLQYPTSPVATRNTNETQRAAAPRQGTIQVAQSAAPAPAPAAAAPVAAAPVAAAPASAPAQQPAQLTTLTMERTSGAAPSVRTEERPQTVISTESVPAADVSSGQARIQSPPQVVTTLENRPDGSTAVSVAAVSEQTVPPTAQYTAAGSNELAIDFASSCPIIEKVNVEAKLITQMLSISQRNYASDFNRWATNVCSQDRGRARILWTVIDQLLNSGRQVSEEQCVRDLGSHAIACSSGVRNGRVQSSVFEQ